MSDVIFVNFEGKVRRIEGRNLELLRSFQGDGETPEQCLERLAVEEDYESKEQQQLYDGKLDYFINVYPTQK